MDHELVELAGSVSARIAAVTSLMDRRLAYERRLEEAAEGLAFALRDCLHEIGNRWTRFGVPPERWEALKHWGDDPLPDAERQWVLAWRAFARGRAALLAYDEARDAEV